MQVNILKKLKKGDLFKRIIRRNGNLVPGQDVYVRGEYIRSCKSFSCYKYEDVNSEILLKGSTIVAFDFIY